MASESQFLVNAKALCFETPEKVEKCKKENGNGSPDQPSSSAKKRLCSSTEKFLKQLPGDTSYVRESWISRSVSFI